MDIIYIGLSVLAVAVVAFLAWMVIKTWRQLKGGESLPQVEAKPKEKPPLKDVIHAPTRYDDPGILDRLAPLFYEEARGNKWKLSLGRVSFWAVLFVFLGMCISTNVTLADEKVIDPNLPTLYLGVISLLFLTLLGLLAYNLGSKFTEPMTKFLVAWSNKNSQPTNAVESQPKVGSEPPV